MALSRALNSLVAALNTKLIGLSVDDHGVVRTILEYPKELGRNIDEVVRIVKGLQLFDATQLMPPANWPNNEIMGDKVLVPPATKLTDAQMAEQHVTKLSDWFRFRNAE